MKSATLKLTIALAAAAALAGCAKEEKTSYGDARGVETVTNQFGSTDLQLMAESMARSMNQAPIIDRKSTRLNSSHRLTSRMPSSA